MARALLIYATREGQTARIAQRIAAGLSAEGVTVDLADASDRPALDSIETQSYDLLVFGASMHVGGIEREIAAFINERGSAIALRPRAFFLVLLSAATPDPAIRRKWLDDARSKLDQQLEPAFDDVEMIAGALRYSQYSWPVKWIMRRIARQVGADTDTRRDYEYTDWAQVADFARRLARRLQ